jgi:hypothetical protein
MWAGAALVGSANAVASMVRGLWALSAGLANADSEVASFADFPSLLCYHYACYACNDSGPNVDAYVHAGVYAHAHAHPHARPAVGS